MKHFNQVFDVVEGQPTARKKARSWDQMSFSVDETVEINQPDDNIWEQPEQLRIYVGKDGIGYEHEVPGGYSEYTYDPDVTSNFYVGADLDWFLRLGLDSNLHSMLTESDLEILKFAMSNPEFLNP